MDQRTRLLEAAITCLEQRGYARTTTRDIVAEAGAHLPAVNYYFGSKDALLGEAVVEAIRRWVETTMAAARHEPGAGAHERLRGNLEGYFATMEANRPYIVAAAEAFAQATRSEEIRDRLASEYRRARGEIAADVTDAAGGKLDSTDAGAVAAVLLALYDGLAIQWLIARGEAPDAARVMRGVEILTAAVTEGRRMGRE